MTVVEVGINNNKLMKSSSRSELKKRSPLLRKKDSPLRHANIVSGMPKPKNHVKNLYNNKNNSPGKQSSNTHKHIDSKSNFNKRQEISPKKLGLPPGYAQNMDHSLTNLSIKNLSRPLASSRNVTGTTHNLSAMAGHSNNQSTLSLKDKIDMKLNQKSSGKLLR